MTKLITGTVSFHLVKIATRAVFVSSLLGPPNLSGSHPGTFAFLVWGLWAVGI